MLNVYNHLFTFCALAIWIYAAIHQTFFAFGVIGTPLPDFAPVVAYVICAAGTLKEWNQIAGERE